MKKYLVLIAYAPDAWNEGTPEQRKAWHHDHVVFHEAVGAALLAGEALDEPETATTLRQPEGRVVLTDGPFAETAEMIGGFYLVQAPDLDQMTQWCALLPDCYSLEIRPCIEIDMSS